MLPAASYYAFGGIGYSQLGTHFNYDRPVTSELPPGLWSSLANAGLLAHCITAYMVWNAHAMHSALIRERHVLYIGQSSLSAFIMPLSATILSVYRLSSPLFLYLSILARDNMKREPCADQHQYLDPACATYVCTT